MKTPTAVMITVMLGGCMSQTASGVWKRVDGRPIPSDPALLQQAKLATTICEGEAVKIWAINPYSDGTAQHTAMKACMAQRGYVFVSD